MSKSRFFIILIMINALIYMEIYMAAAFQSYVSKQNISLKQNVDGQNQENESALRRKV